MISLLKKLPLIGTLFVCRSQDFLEAFKEIGITILISTAPLTLALLSDILSPGDISFFDYLSERSKSGVLNIYASAIIAPVFYLVVNESVINKNRRFPSALLLFILALVIFISSLFLYLKIEVNGLNFPFDVSKFFQFSFASFLVSIFLTYIGFVYKNLSLTGASHLTGSEGRNFAKNYQRKHRD